MKDISKIRIKLGDPITLSGWQDHPTEDEISEAFRRATEEGDSLGYAADAGGEAFRSMLLEDVIYDMRSGKPESGFNRIGICRTCDWQTPWLDVRLLTQYFTVHKHECPTALFETVKKEDYDDEWLINERQKVAIRLS